MNVVGHKEMVFVLHHGSVAAQLANHIFRRSVISFLGFARILVDKGPHSLRKFLGPYKLQKSPGGTVTVNGIAQAHNVVGLQVQPLIVERVDFIQVNRPASILQTGLQFL